MNPLLRRGDTLLVVPCLSEDLHPGDIIVFADPLRRQVVHRVWAVTADGLITKGDNMPHVDDWVVAPQDILGRVVAIARQGRLLPVTRKVPISLYFLRVRQWGDRAFSRLFRPLYQRLWQSGFFQGVLPGWLKPKLVHFPRSEGSEWQLWLGELLIGRKLPHQAAWTIRRSFKLFVDEASLPTQPPDSPETFPPKP
ncbi:MAG: S24/S26 family peptidase [Desulfobaccales bacterium]